MEQDQAIAVTTARLTVEEAGERYLHHLEHVLERKASTVQDYRIMLDRHMAPFFGDRPLERIDPDGSRPTWLPSGMTASRPKR